MKKLFLVVCILAIASICFADTEISEQDVQYLSQNLLMASALGLTITTDIERIDGIACKTHTYTKGETEIEKFYVKTGKVALLSEIDNEIAMWESKIAALKVTKAKIEKFDNDVEP